MKKVKLQNITVQIPESEAVEQLTNQLEKADKEITKLNNKIVKLEREKLDMKQSMNLSKNVRDKLIYHLTELVELLEDNNVYRFYDTYGQ